jgi:hypothetical protein
LLHLTLAAEQASQDKRSLGARFGVEEGCDAGGESRLEVGGRGMSVGKSVADVIRPSVLAALASTKGA